MTFSRNAKCGNWQKYNNPNPLQQFLIRRFLGTVGCLVERSGALILADVGCAEGFVTRYLRSLRPEIRCVGIDIDVNALERGKLISPDRQAQQASIYNIPYTSGAFDLVLCLEVFEHLDRPAGALVELMRVTRQYCLLGVPHEPFFCIANFLRGKNLTRLGNDIEHVNHWGKVSFVRFLQDSGLVVRGIEMSFPWLVALAELGGKG